MRSWKIASLVTAVALVSMTVAGVVARAQVLAPVHSGSAITLVKIATGEHAASTSSQRWKDVPGASAIISIPVGTRAIIDVRLFSDSYCRAISGTPDGSCSVQMMIGGQAGDPVGGGNWGFVQGGVSDRRGLKGMEESRGPLGPGRYTVRVQISTSDPSIRFGLLGFHLTVERITV